MALSCSQVGTYYLRDSGDVIALTCFFYFFALDTFLSEYVSVFQSHISYLLTQRDLLHLGIVLPCGVALTFK